MKKLILGLLVIFVLMLAACSDDDDDSSTEPEVVYGYGLEQFVPIDELGSFIAGYDPADSVDVRNLFYFWAFATDGFSARTRGYDDLNWDNMAQGYYIPELDNRLNFPQFAPLNIGAYNVKYMDKVCVYRGVTSVVNDTLSVVYELGGMEMTNVENYDGEQESAIALSAFVPPHVAAIDSVEFTAADGYAKMYYPEEIADGYWLVESQKTIFPNLDLPGSKKKFKMLQTMTFHGTLQEVEEFDNSANWGSEAEADWTLEFPEDLSGYVGEVWE